MDWGELGLQVLVAVLATIGGFASVAPYTNNSSNNKVNNGILRFINMMAQNRSKAANK